MSESVPGDTHGERIVARQRGSAPGRGFPDPLLLLCLILTGIGAVGAKLALATIGAVALGVVIFARLWARLSLERVDIERTFSRQQIFRGDSVEVTITIANRKPLPLPWIKLSFLLPDGLQTLRSGGHRRFEGGVSFYESFSLARYERMTATRTLQAVRRGCYRLGAAHLESGDLFGFYTSHQESLATTAELVVFPVPCPLPGFAIVPCTPHGDAPNRSPHHEDYSRPNGLREYRAGDALRHVDWKATARHRTPYVRTFDASHGFDVVIVLESATSEHGWRFRPETLEAAVVAAASVARIGIDSGHRVGLITNGLSLGSGQPELGPAAGRVQFERIMHSLARVQPMPTWSLEQRLPHPGNRGEQRVLPVTYVYVSALVRPSTDEALASAVRAGARAQCVYVGPGQAPRYDFMTVYHAHELLIGAERTHASRAVLEA